MNEVQIGSVLGDLLRVTGPDGEAFTHKDMKLCLQDPENNGVPVNTLIFANLSAFAPDGGEYAGQHLIDAGLAFRCVHRATYDDGSVVEVIGAGSDKPAPAGKGADWPAPGYQVNEADGTHTGLQIWGAEGPGPGRSLGMTVRFRLEKEGYVTFFGSVNGQEVDFKVGNRVRIGKYIGHPKQDAKHNAAAAARDGHTE